MLSGSFRTAGSLSIQHERDKNSLVGCDEVRIARGRRRCLRGAAGGGVLSRHTAASRPEKSTIDK